MTKIKKRKTAAVLACRVNSTRLYGKPLQKLGKYTILELLVTQLKKSKFIDDIVLAISDEHGNDIFIEIAKKMKIKYVVGGEENVLKRLLKGATSVNADLVFRLSSENPFIFWEGIDDAIIDHIKGNFDFSLVTPLPLGSGFEIIDFKILKKSFLIDKSKKNLEHCDEYIINNKNKFKINVIKPIKILQRDDLRLTVDTPYDLILVRKIMEHFKNSKQPKPLLKIIKFLDKNPELKKINSHILMNEKYGDAFK